MPLLELLVALAWWIGLFVSAAVSVLVIVCLAAWVVDALLLEHTHPDFDADHSQRERIGLLTVNKNAPAPWQRPGA
jgi:hypothetical protein